MCSIKSLEKMFEKLFLKLLFYIELLKAHFEETIIVRLVLIGKLDTFMRHSEQKA